MKIFNNSVSAKERSFRLLDNRRFKAHVRALNHLIFVTNVPRHRYVCSAVMGA